MAQPWHSFVLPQEFLVQRGISTQAEQWIKESRDRLHVDKLLAEAAK